MVESRLTRQKRILDTESKKIKGFFNAEQLLKKVNLLDKKIGIATIYRYLKESKKNNSLYSYQCEGKTIYSNTKTSHCHFICEESGKTFHFEIDNLDFIKNKVPGDITSISIEVRGVCSKHEH